MKSTILKILFLIGFSVHQFLEIFRKITIPEWMLAYIAKGVIISACGAFVYLGIGWVLGWWRKR